MRYTWVIYKLHQADNGYSIYHHYLNNCSICLSLSCNNIKPALSRTLLYSNICFVAHNRTYNVLRLYLKLGFLRVIYNFFVVMISECLLTLLTAFHGLLLCILACVCIIK
ncbi:hypothetical protein HanRHA438_Chr14g0651561 [Helianthus annuus]|nr:hypothetical protein HanHA89_Chr14g0569051 [Helianthus annuus]KAJ0656052.1 hypothetical protein HanLR1_Chr14g0531431 [Helianthus annuus]KAJ0659729.1 hypothetical protein HanOQP8_Chr14g0529521 [Helianthus annuus]KAJ0853467.1 hypothetical protein HanRHA438_Chr14g0651561 [Helianthus annuus]